MLLHTNQRLIDYDLVELCFHSRDDLVERIAKREVGAVSLKEGTANRRPRRPVKNQLPSKDADAVGYIAQLSIGDTRCRRRIGQCGTCRFLDLRWRWVNNGWGPGCGRGSRRCTGSSRTSQYPGANQIRISPFKSSRRCDVRQRLRADFDDDAFRPFDLLFRVEESRIALQRRQDRLIKRKRGNTACGRCFTACRRRSTACAGACQRARRNHCGSEPEDYKIFSHEEMWPERLDA